MCASATQRSVSPFGEVNAVTLPRTSDDADPAAEPTGDDAPEANEDAPSA